MPEETVQTTPQSDKEPKKKKGMSGLLIALIVIIGGFFALIVGLVLAIRFGLIKPMNWLMSKLPSELTPVVSQLSSLDGDQAKLGIMMQTGQSGICTITHADQPESKIVYHVKGDKLKIESTDFYEGETNTYFVLSDGEYTYAWDSTSMEGTKSRMMTDDEKQELDEAIAQYNAGDFEWDDAEFEDDDNVIVDCQFKNVPDSEFVVPTNVNFTDLSEMMDQAYDFGNEEEAMFDEDEIARLEEWAQEMQEKYAEME